MIRIRAFRGLCPAPGREADVACVPYDVVNREEAAREAEGRPDSLMRVDRAEIELPPETDPYSDAVYARALENFRGLQERGALVREAEPVLYAYRQVMGKHVQTGLVAVCHIEDYENGLIKKHEKTRKDKEDDRTRLIGTLRADTGPVFLTYRGDAAIDAAMEEATAGRAAFDFTAPDGIRHTVWRIRDAGGLPALFARHVPVAYVADGHHRTASAVRVGRELREANPAHDGTEEYNWFLAVLFPADQLRILPYNRLVKDLRGLGPEALLAGAARHFAVEENAAPEPPAPGQISMYLGGKWYGLRWDPATGADPISRLDVSALQDRILAPLLGVDDPRTSKRIEFVGGIRGTGELVSKVDSGQAAVAFSMFPTTVGQLMDIADAGQIMPPKSTWFEPKLRSGLFIHTF